MTRTPVPEAGPAHTQDPPPPSPPPTPPGLVSGLLKALDSLLSPELRQGSPSELVRSRVMAAACCFMLVFIAIAVVTFPISRAFGLLLAVLSLSYGVTLVLMRRATSPTRPALLLCATITFGSASAPFLLEAAPYIGTHGV